MEFLILGGTRFVGRHIVESALKKGHAVTLFNRGREDAELFPDIEKLNGDRYTDLDVLNGREWDAVIDTCGYEPKAVYLSAEKLKDSVDQYIYISSGSVYQDWCNGDMDENSEVKVLTESATAEVEKILETESPSSTSLLKYYGELKAACEQQLEAIIPGKVLNVRSGVIVGPYDYSFRFTYWVDRIARGGRLVCPDRPEAPVRFIDARDLADWIILSAEQKVTGVFNTWGKAWLTFGKFLMACQEAGSENSELVWISEEQLLANEVKPWSDLPLWLPSEYQAYFRANDKKAIQHGLNYRPMEETIQDTLTWQREAHSTYTDPDGLSAERQEELLMKTKWN